MELKLAVGLSTQEPVWPVHCRSGPSPSGALRELGLQHPAMGSQCLGRQWVLVLLASSRHAPAIGEFPQRVFPTQGLLRPIPATGVRLLVWKQQQMQVCAVLLQAAALHQALSQVFAATP